MTNITNICRLAVSAYGLAITLSARPALAASPSASYGDTAACILNGASRLQCSFKPLALSSNLQIQYLSLQCNYSPNSQNVLLAIAALQILTIPGPATDYITYQIPITASNSVWSSTSNSPYSRSTGVLTSSSSVTLYSRGGTTPLALIETLPGQAQTLAPQCTVSLSGSLTP
jgi:hypothetical protein